MSAIGRRSMQCTKSEYDTSADCAWPSLCINLTGTRPAALTLIIALVAATAVAAEPGSKSIDRLYVFGDSYSDGGNGYALTGTPRSAPYDSRYSNGMTAVEHMARLFGLSLRHSEASGLATDASLNFAVSGAWTSSRNNDRAMDGKTGLLSQVAEFERRAKDRTLQFSPDTTLFFVAIGINDVLFGNLGGIDNATLVAGALENVEKAAHALNATGARHIALAMLPMVGLTPRGASLPAATGKAVKDAVVALNEGYQRMAGRLRAELKADVFTLPWGQYYDELMHNPAAFGLMNVGSCGVSGSAAVCVPRCAASDDRGSSRRRISPGHGQLAAFRLRRAGASGGVGRATDVPVPLGSRRHLRRTGPVRPGTSGDGLHAAGVSAIRRHVQQLHGTALERRGEARVGRGMDRQLRRRPSPCRQCTLAADVANELGARLPRRRPQP